jgi:hypothetical protein
MKIKITDKNADLIEAALANVNGKATSFAVTKYDEVANVAKQAEHRLSLLPTKDRAGAVAGHIPAGPRARSYGYAAQSTRVSLSRGASAWYLVNVERVSIQPKRPAQLGVGISAEQQTRIMQRAVAEFAIIS